MINWYPYIIGTDFKELTSFLHLLIDSSIFIEYFMGKYYGLI